MTLKYSAQILSFVLPTVALLLFCAWLQSELGYFLNWTWDAVCCCLCGVASVVLSCHGLRQIVAVPQGTEWDPAPPHSRRGFRLTMIGVVCLLVSVACLERLVS